MHTAMREPLVGCKFKIDAINADLFHLNSVKQQERCSYPSSRAVQSLGACFDVHTGLEDKIILYKATVNAKCPCQIIWNRRDKELL